MADTESTGETCLRATTEQHIFRVFDADGSGALELEELAETWRALSGQELAAETLRAVGAEPGGSLTFGQFQRLLRGQLPHVVDLLATVNSELVAKGRRALNKREIAELLSRVGPSLVSILEAGHPAMPRPTAHGKRFVCPSDLDEAAARASADFHAEIHSLAGQLASAHRDAAQQWTDEEVEILWLSHDAMERERDAALEDCARARAELAEVMAERDALAKLASSTRTVRSTARPRSVAARSRTKTLGLRNLTHETHDLAQGEHEKLPERGYLDQLYLEELEHCDADVMREMVEECGVGGIVPEQLMQTPLGLREILCAYVSGRPAATSTTVCGYVWGKDGAASAHWILYWAVLECTSNARGSGVDAVLKLCSSEEHAGLIRQGKHSIETIRVSTAASPVVAINLRECVEVRRPTAPLATAGELELVSASATHQLCAPTRGDSRVWARVLAAAMRPSFGTSQELFRRAVRQQLTITQFLGRLISVQPPQPKETEQAHRGPPPPPPPPLPPPQPTPPPPPPPPPLLPHKLKPTQSAQVQDSNTRSALDGDDDWRHVCDCPHEIVECELCKSHFAPPRAPDFKSTVPDGCEFLESIRYSQRRKAAHKAWPWAPYSEMECYAAAKSEGVEGGQAQSKAVHPPWHPFSPPFNRSPEAGCSLLEGLQFKQAQEKAAIAYSMAARRHTSNGHDGTLGDTWGNNSCSFAAFACALVACMPLTGAARAARRGVRVLGGESARR